MKHLIGFFAAFSILMLALSSCAPEKAPTPTLAQLPPTLTSIPPSATLTFTSTPSPKPSPTIPTPTPTEQLPATSSFTLQPGKPHPMGRHLIAYQAANAQDKILVLADPAENTLYEYKFPATAHFATPFLAGLSPDGRYFVYFEGGWLDAAASNRLRADKPDLVLHVRDLNSGEDIFSAPLLSPSYPQDLAQIAGMIKDDWMFQDHAFEDVVKVTQGFMLEYIRSVAWSPDSSLLAFASQNPGPSSDLYLLDLENRTARRVDTDPYHILRTVWAPDSSALILDSCLYSSQAPEVNSYLLSREGSALVSFPRSEKVIDGWHDATYAIQYRFFDGGDNHSVDAISARDGTISVLWEGSFADIAFLPDLSAFLLSSSFPSLPAPDHAGLYLGKRGDLDLLTLSENLGWQVEYWGSGRFAFAASSTDEGTIGVTLDGERLVIDERGWGLAASPGSRYLAGYFASRPNYYPGRLPGLRVFDGSGQVIESLDNINVVCVRWNAAATALAYQAESRLYLWDAASGSTRLVSTGLDEQGCAVAWVQDTP